MVMNFNSDSKISNYKSQLNSSLSLEDLEDLQDLRRAKQKQEDEPIYSLQEVRAVLDGSAPYNPSSYGIGDPNLLRRPKH